MSSSKIIGLRVSEVHLHQIDRILEHMKTYDHRWSQVTGRKYSKWVKTKQDALLWALMNVNIVDQNS